MSITYNGSDPFVDQPTPFVTFRNEYSLDGNERVDRRVVTLRGELIGCSKSELDALREAILSAFNVRADLVIPVIGTIKVENVISVSFPDGEYFSRLPYSISLQAKDAANLFNKAVDVTFDESRDQSLTITRKISAKAKKSSANETDAWDSVKNYISSEAAKALPRPVSIESKNYQYFLVSSDENWDRINNELSLTQTFKCDLFYNLSVIYRYTTEIQIDQNGYIVNMSGTIEFDRNSDAQYVEAKKAYDSLKGINWIDKLLLNGREKYLDLTDESINIDRLGGKISFTLQYTERNGFVYDNGKYYNSYEISLEDGSDTSLISVSVNGEYGIADLKNLSSKTALLTNFTADVVNKDYLYSECNKLYREFFTVSNGTTVSLKTLPLSVNYSLSRSGTKIIWSAQFNDRYLLADNNYLNYTIESTPSKKVFSKGRNINNQYFFLDHGHLSNAEMSISMQSKECDQALTFNRLPLAEFTLRKFIEEDKGSGDLRVGITERQYSASSEGDSLATVRAIYKGEEFAI